MNSNETILFFYFRSIRVVHAQAMMLTLLGVSSADENQKVRELKKEIEQLNQKIKQFIAKTDTALLSKESESLKSKGTFHQQSPQKLGLFVLDPPATFALQRELKGHFGKIYAIDFASNSQDIVSASRDGQLFIWNIATKTKRVAIPLPNAWVMTCAFSPNMCLIASGGTDNVLSLFNVENSNGWDIKDASKQLSSHSGFVSCVRFISNERCVTSSGDQTCIMWDIEKESVLEKYEGHSGDVDCLSLNANQSPNIFATGAGDATVKVWDTREYTQNGRKPIVTFRGHEDDCDVTSVQWFPDGHALFSGSDDKTVRLWDMRSRKQINEYKAAHLKGSVTSVACSHSGYYMLAAYDDNPHCIAWNTMTGEIMHEFPDAHPTRVSCVQISPNGKLIATGCWDQCLRIFGNL